MKKFKIPKKIKICGIEYEIDERKIEEERAKCKVEEGEVDGFADVTQRKIVVGECDLKDERWREFAFFHELSHALIYEFKYFYPFLDRFVLDEQFINELGLSLRDVFFQILKEQEKK